VPGFNILHKTLADDDGWDCGLAPLLRDRDEVLDLFNKTMARDKNLGQFTFDENDLTSDYNLVEIVKTSIGGDEQIFHPLFKKR
jgi:hypothetical protein